MAPRVRECELINSVSSGWRNGAKWSETSAAGHRLWVRSDPSSGKRFSGKEANVCMSRVSLRLWRTGYSTVSLGVEQTKWLTADFSLMFDLYLQTWYLHLYVMLFSKISNMISQGRAALCFCCGSSLPAGHQFDICMQSLHNSELPEFRLYSLKVVRVSITKPWLFGISWIKALWFF